MTLLKCLQAGFQQVFEHNEALTILSKSIDPSLQSVMMEAVKIMAAACLFPPSGHEKVLEAITINAENENKERFSSIIEGLKTSDNDALCVACMQLINALIANNDDLDFRIHLRNEFLRCGFYDLWETWCPSEDESNLSSISKELSVQLKVFNDAKDEDFEELSQRYENIRFDLDDSNECFNLIRNTVQNTPSEPHLLSILQHLLLIRDDPFARYK